MELIGYFWSGLHHRPIKGINLITLYHTDPEGKSVPVNYRIYNKQEGKTKNDYLREMIEELAGAYSQRLWLETLGIQAGKTWNFWKQELGFLFGIAKK